MNYYSYSALIFNDGQIKDAINLLYKSEKPATVIEFKKDVKEFHAGIPGSYSGIVIACWEKIDKETFDYINNGFLSA